MKIRKFVDVTADVAPDLVAPGSVKDALWTDLNQDGFPDLVVVGEWMPISIFINKNGAFRDASAEFGTGKLKGWWYSIDKADLDNDGDEDLVAGNLGLNGKFHTAPGKPFNVFANDFDENGTCDVVLSKEYKGRLVPTRGRQCSSQQMPFIKEKFPTYKDFANAGVEDILGKEKIKKSLHLQVTTFKSLVLLNEGGKFIVQNLPNEAQIAPINSIICSDLDGDGNQDIIVAGNNFDAEVETPRYDAGSGLVLKGNGDGTFVPVLARQSGFYAPGNVKNICLLNHAIGIDKLILVASNNAPMQVFELKVTKWLSMR